MLSPASLGLGCDPKRIYPDQSSSPVHELDETAYHWVRKHYQNLPNKTCPASQELQAFANYFSTYLTTSFDLLPDPPKNMAPGSCGCTCPMCRYFVQGPHLRAKKVSEKDKRRAKLLMEFRLQALAQEEKLSLSESTIQTIIDGQTRGTLQPKREQVWMTLRRQAAFSTYGYWLIQRLGGYTDGASILALWREIAYEKSGSPIKGFKLDYDDFELSEHSLMQFMQTKQ